MRIYAFYNNGITFLKFKSLKQALFFTKGDESRIFAHVQGIPNPWFVHPIKNGKVNRSKILNPSQLDKAKNKFKSK